MTRGPTKTALRDLDTLFGAGTVAGMTDAQLLERFLDRRCGAEAAELAFSALVERHGPMVLGVCRRVLRDTADAEDAFQSTFLVLIRKARSIHVTSNLGPWLFTVALRTAQEARARATRRRARETRVVAMRRAEPEPNEVSHELRGVLDAELGRLPERYRAPLVLCELEGRSRREAAVLLGVPEGTVSSRLSRGRTILRERLARRGLAVTAGALAVALSRETTAAPIPPALEALTVQAAMRIAAGHAAAGAVSAPVAALTEGVLKAMLLTKLKGILVVTLTGAAVVAGAGVLAQQPAPSTTTGFTADPLAVAGSGNDRLQALEQKIDRLLNAIEASEKRAVGQPATHPVPPPPAPTPASPYPPGVPYPPAATKTAAGRGGSLRTPHGEMTIRVDPAAASPFGSPAESEWRGDVERRLRQLEKRVDEVVATLQRRDDRPPSAAPDSRFLPTPSAPATK